MSPPHLLQVIHPHSILPQPYSLQKCPFPLPTSHRPRSPIMGHDPSQRSLQTMQISPKFHNRHWYRSLVQKILNCFPGTILCCTDRSKIGDRTGFAYSISDRIFVSHHRNSCFYPSSRTSGHFSVPGENPLYPFSAVPHTLSLTPYSPCQLIQMFILFTP